MNPDERFEKLWTDFLEGELSPAGIAELQSLLEDQPYLQTKAGDLLQTHRLISFALPEDVATGEAFVQETLAKLPRTEADFHDAVMRRVQRAAPIRAEARWPTWRPMAAASAGILLGIACTTAVFAYVVAAPTKVTTLLQEGFETGPAPGVVGAPLEPGEWSGDYSEIAGPQSGVKPAGGSRMLRFLRGDYERRSIPQSFGCDVSRLIDVRPYRQEFADGDGFVRLTGVFNSAAFAEQAEFECTLTIFALDAEVVNGRSLRIEGTLSAESLAYSRSSRIALDRNPETWQKASNELRLPPNTDYLMIRVGVSDVARRKGKQTAGFTGQFADQVQLVIAHRPEISVP